MTAREWLQLPDDTLGTELAKALVDGPWKHVWRDGYCVKCDFVPRGCPTNCDVPDPIDIHDLDLAVKYFREAGRSYGVMRKLLVSVWEALDSTWDFEGWLIFAIQPKHYLIAAAIAKENQG